MLLTKKQIATLLDLKASKGKRRLLDLNVSTVGSLTSKGLIDYQFPTVTGTNFTTVVLTPAGSTLAKHAKAIINAPGYFETMALLAPQKKLEKEL